LRLGVALSLTALIGSQLPVTGVTALAQDSYGGSDEDDSGDFLGINGLSNRDVIQGAVFALVAYGIAATLSGRNGSGEAAAGAAGQNPALVPPPGDKPIWDALYDDSAKRFTEFTSITEINELKENPLRDQENKPYTVFAPTDAAIRALPPGVVGTLKNAQNKEANQRILLYHVVKGYQYTPEDMKKMADGTTIATMNGDTVTVNNAGGSLKINGNPILEQQIPANNGVAYAIETVLTPAAAAPGAAAPAPENPATGGNTPAPAPANP
jgi:uncharacterized surface protein with fasciclin (FAS1) repeats